MSSQAKPDLRRTIGDQHSSMAGVVYPNRSRDYEPPLLQEVSRINPVVAAAGLWRTGARVRKRAGNGAGKKGKRRAGKKELWVSGAIS
jgi:hypothetical protein